MVRLPHVRHGGGKAIPVTAARKEADDVDRHLVVLNATVRVPSALVLSSRWIRSWN